ncbi:MAG: hypothetical protein OK436_01740 [Thaumarchaeota archaeon]|nr:hypothetical protein [Nitrososphaerota archaeon]
MTNPRIALGATVFLLALLLGTQVIVPQAAQTASASAPGKWWNNAYEFRRTVTVSNQGLAAVVNQSVVVHLEFNGSYIQDAFTGVRLVDSSGNEVPSAVVGLHYSGNFLQSAYLVFSADIPASSSSLYYLYYGATLQPPTSYRSSQPSTSIGTAYLSASEQAISLDSTQIQLALGTVDSETTATKVKYTLGGELDFGPTTIARAPFANDTGLISAGDIRGPSVVGYESLQAGALQLTRILIISAKGAVTIDAVANDSPSSIANVRLITLVGLRGLNTLGTSSSSYDVGSSVLTTQNPDGYFVMGASPNPSSHTVGTDTKVAAEAISGTFDGVSSSTQASAAAFAWDVGDLQPATSALVSSSWAVSPSGPAGAAIPPAPSTASLGGMEVKDRATPRASSIWSGTATITDVTIPAGGLTIPFGIGAGQLMPDASSVTGKYGYTVPPSPQQDIHSWISATSIVGGATSLASKQYFDFATGQTVSRLHTFSPGPTSAAAASLTSLGGFTFGGINDALQVRYKASHSTVSGNFSAQSFFVAADFDPTLSGNYNESIILSVSGSSTVLPAGCPISGSPGGTTKVVSSGSLIGDNTWRSTSIGLPASLPTSGFNVRLRLCLSSTAGYSGTMDFEISSAGIVHKGFVSDVIQVTFSRFIHEVTLGFVPQAQPISTAGVVANLTVHLAFQTNSSVAWGDGSSFTGMTKPAQFMLNVTLGQTSTLGRPRLEGVLVNSAVSNFARSGQVNGTSVPTSANPGASLLSVGRSTSGSSNLPFKVGLQSETLKVQVLDKDQSGVPGVTVVPSSDGVNLPITILTDSAGGAQVKLVPWTYKFNATYQGLFVGSSSGGQVGTQPTISIQANLYQLTLLVKDNRGGTMAGAKVTLSIGNLNITGTTNNQGKYPFEAVANAIYGLTVGSGSATYFSGRIGATANNAVVQVTTTYIPASTELEVAILLAIVPVALVAAYYARKSRSSK